MWRLTILELPVHSSQERPQQQPHTCARCRTKPPRICHTATRSARPYARCTLHAPPCDATPGVPQGCDAHKPAATRCDCDPSGMRASALTLVSDDELASSPRPQCSLRAPNSLPPFRELTRAPCCTVHLASHLFAACVCRAQVSRSSTDACNDDNELVYTLEQR